MKYGEIVGTASGTAASFLEQECRGQVLMVNSAGIYLELGDRIFLLCDDRWGLTPIGIGVPDFDFFAEKWKILPSDPVRSHRGGLQFACGWIKIEKTCLPAFSPAPVDREKWQLGIRTLKAGKRGLWPLADGLLAGGKMPEGDPLCALARPRLEKLLRGLVCRDTATITGAVEALLGLGPGLTPSADDVLCGLMYGLLRSGKPDDPEVKDLCRAVCREAEGRTHRVSAAYLRAIAGGEPYQRLEEAWLTLTGRREAGFERLLEVGSSSGGDCLLGLLLAGRICMEREE